MDLEGKSPLRYKPLAKNKRLGLLLGGIILGVIAFSVYFIIISKHY